MKCKHCGKEIANESKYCNFCGTGQTVMCKQCGSEITYDSVYCEFCGAMQKTQSVKSMNGDGYVDLGLPSGTKWKDKDEVGGFYTYEEAVKIFGDKLPTKIQLKELKDKCSWEWDAGSWERLKTTRGYRVTGPNGKSIFLPIAGYCDCDGGVGHEGVSARYWSSTPYVSDYAWSLHFVSGIVDLSISGQRYGYSVRLVQE